MSGNNADWKKKLQEILAADEYHNRIEELKKKTDRATQRRVELSGKYTKDRDADTKKVFQQVLKNKERGDMDRSIHTSNIASMLIDATPRLEALVKFFVGKTHNVLGKYARDFDNNYTGVWSQSWHTSHEAYHNVETYVSECLAGKREFDIPDLRYFVGIGEDGELTHSWHDIADYYTNDNSQEKSYKDEFVTELQSATIEWVESLDGGDDGHKYFASIDGNGKYKIYPKSVGIQDVNGNLILNIARVRERYDQQDYDIDNGVITIKPGAQPNDGGDPLHLTNEQFSALMNTPGNKFGDFLENRFDGIGMSFAPKP